MDGVSQRLRALLTRTVGGVPVVVPLAGGVAIVAVLCVYVLASPPGPAVVRSSAAPATGKPLPAVDQPPDPCTLLNVPEVAWVLGAPLSVERPSLATRTTAERRCTWSTRTAPFTTADLVVVTATSARASVAMTIDENYAAASGALPDGHDVAGLGETARYSPARRAVYVKLKSAWFGLDAAGGLPGPRLEAALVGLARTVARRYPH
jgi:hypothetical protein